MEFKVSNGPWQPLFEGKMQGHNTEVLVNPDGLVLALIYESEEGIYKGVLAQCYKAFLARGDLESFLETLPRKALMLARHSESETFKFLLLDSGTAYAAYEENAVVKETDALMAKIRSFSSLVQEVCTAYDIDLIEIEKASDEEKMAFYSIPLVSLLASPMIKKEEGALRTELGHGEIMLGVTKKGTIVKEPFDFFDLTQIEGGEKSDRLHLFHILIESSLLSNIPATIVDWQNVFTGLHFPNENVDELKKFKVETDPLGFPIKFFKVGQELKAELAFVDGEAFLEAFGLKGTPPGVIITQALAIGKSNSVGELIDRVNSIPEGEHVTPFRKREAVRILMLIDSIYPGLFSGNNPVKDISEGWVRGIGRANIILLEKTDMRKNLLVLQSLVSGLLAWFKTRGKSNSLKGLFFLSEADIAMPEFKARAVNERIAADVTAFREYGVGVIIESREKASISKKVRESMHCELAVINKNDVGVIVKNRKNYRALIRPGLSKCTEKGFGVQKTAEKIRQR